MRDGDYMLDVGIGNATALTRNKELVVSKNLNVHGVDIDLDYIIAAKTNIINCDMQDRITVGQ
jgi:hypothetical protein